MAGWPLLAAPPTGEGRLPSRQSQQLPLRRFRTDLLGLSKCHEAPRYIWDRTRRQEEIDRTTGTGGIDADGALVMAMRTMTSRGDLVRETDTGGALVIMTASREGLVRERHTEDGVGFIGAGMVMRRSETMMERRTRELAIDQGGIATRIVGGVGEAESSFAGRCLRMCAQPDRWMRRT
jgi:hypothetical protein